MKYAKKKKKGSGQRKALIVLCVVLAVILVGLIALTVFVEGKFSLLDRTEGHTRLSAEELAALLQGDELPEDFTGSLIDADSIDLDKAQLIGGENVINILLVGCDSRTSGGEGRSDATILCTINEKDKTITLTSFMRDMWVKIPDYFNHKFNTAYALGGFEVLDATLEENFGVQVDGNVAVDFVSFVEVIDAVGGIDIELTEEEVEHLNSGYWWDLTPGLTHLNGEEALAYSRIRYVADAEGNDGDFGRTNRQRIVLTKLIEKAKDLSLTEINSLLDTVLPMISTDLSNSEIVGYVLEVFPLLSGCTVNTQQIPAENTYHLDWVDVDGGLSVILVDDMEANRSILRDIIGD